MGPEDAILLEPYGAVYVEVPKVACTSVKVALAGILGVNLAEADGNPHKARFPLPALADGPHGPLYPGWFAFAFVRNPWDRVVSCYRDKIGGDVEGYTEFTIRTGVADCLAGFQCFTAGMSFRAFVEAVAAIPDDAADAHFRSQHTFVCNRAGELAVDFVGRFERLAADWAEVCGRTGLPPVVLPRLQAARASAHYAAYYEPDTRRVIAERYRTDIELFGYAFKTPAEGL